MSRKYYSEDNGNGGLEFWNVSEVLTGFSEITDLDTLKGLHANRYEQLESDGLEYFHALQAGLYLDIVTGVYTVVEVVVLQSYLKNLSDEIKEGSWLTAKNTITGIALSGIFDQALKDKLTLDINTYVYENY